MFDLASVVAVMAAWAGHRRGGAVLLFLMLLAVIGLLVWLVVLAFRRGHQPSGTDTARSILAERMARGEITPEEYQERLRHLQ
jgi:putative membrane protein